jgi:crossover junction endodeoxyribonuclease RuvC
MPATRAKTRTKILGIDSSLTNSGMCRVSIDQLAVGGPDSPANTWTTDTWCIPSKPGVDRGATGMSNRIAEIIAAMEPHIAAADLVVLEGVSFASTSSSGHALHWLWGRIVDCTQEHAVELLVMPPSLRSHYATGKGNSAKDIVLAATIRRWPTVEFEGNDEADALLLAAIGCRYLGTPIDDVPRAHWEKVMKKANNQ